VNKGRPAYHVELTSDEREKLLALVQKSTAQQRDVVRAKIALLADEGRSSLWIASELGISARMVCKWRKRTALNGIDGLKEAQRAGRPRRISEGERLQLIALACEPQEIDGRTTPTLDELVDRSKERGIVEKISRSNLQRILVSGDIRPHRVKQWLHSPDPAFREKVNIICDLYRKAPEDSVVLSIDEKTSIQAIERKYLDRPTRPGRVRRQEFEYIRHGTQTLTAALDVHSGRVFAVCEDRRTQDDLLNFMEQVAKEYPDKIIHVVWDNLNTHRSAKWAAFNEAHGSRFHFHFTPIHASWVNQVELLFGVYSRRCLRNASHTSKDHLRSRTLAYFEDRNASPKPFKWSFRGFHLQTGEPKRKPGRKANAENPIHP
jgi:transposase